jgi:hypothetical protein
MLSRLEPNINAVVQMEISVASAARFQMISQLGVFSSRNLPLQKQNLVRIVELQANFQVPTTPGVSLWLLSKDEQKCLQIPCPRGGTNRCTHAFSCSERARMKHEKRNTPSFTANC